MPASEELLGALLYLPIVAWIGFAVVRRGGVRLGALLRWPSLGTYWFVVAGMLVVQFVFSLAAITLTELVAPWMDDSLAGVGQGNLVVAAHRSRDPAPRWWRRSPSGASCSSASP